MRDQNLTLPSGAELVRIYGMDASGKAFLATRGAKAEDKTRVRLFSVGVVLAPGDVIGMRYQERRARLRVDVIAPGTLTHDPFVLCSYIDSDPILPQVTEVSASVTRERRAHARLACDLGVSLQTIGGAQSVHARCTDISMGGCYVEMLSPCKIGTRLAMSLWREERRLQFLADVRTSHPGVGMGLRFVEVEAPDELALLLRSLQVNVQPELRVAPTNTVPRGQLP